MAIIGTLAVSVRANTSQYKKGLRKAQTTTQKFALGMRGLASVATSVLAIGLAAVTVATIALVKSQFSAIDSIGKTALQIGITTEKLIGLQHAALIAGSSVESLNKNMIKLLKGISQAKQGLSTQVKALEDLGLRWQDLEGLKPDEILNRVADAMQGVELQTDKVRIAMDIFGRGGKEMLNLMADGAAGIDAMQKEAELLGLTLSRFEVSQIESTNDSFTRLKGLMIGVGRVLAIQVAPFLEALISSFVEAGKEGEGVGVKVKAAFKSVAEFVARLGDKIRKFSIGLLSLQVMLLKVFDPLDRLGEFEGALDKLRNTKSPTAKLELFFEDLKRKAEEAAAALELEAENKIKDIKLPTVELPVEPVLDTTLPTIPVVEEILEAAELLKRQNVGAREIRNLRSVRGGGVTSFAKMLEAQVREIKESVKQSTILQSINEKIGNQIQFEVISI